MASVEGVTSLGLFATTTRKRYCRGDTAGCEDWIEICRANGTNVGILPLWDRLFAVMADNGIGASMCIKLGLTALLALAAATTGSVAFEGKLAAEFKPVSAEGPTTLTYYKASCKQSARPECVIAYLWCDSPQDIGFEINGVADAVLGKWLVKDGAKATMSSGEHLLALQPTEMIMDDMVGGWDLKFNAISAQGGEDAQSWFAGLDPVPKITISTGKGDDVLPIDGDNGKQLSLFLAACRTVGK
jgi:hypothetical protein